MRAMVSPLSTLVLMSSVQAMRAVSVLWFLGNPDWGASMEVVGEGVAEVLGGWGGVDDAGFGLGEFFDDGKEFLAVVCVVVYAFFVEGPFGGPDELVMFAHG
ncbi:hypothetical protein NDU88_008012 [Pleurodeles waltl]|uniref:Secreted protein n=1 Tax=Pleurodeles waltl TaxID=8319 RepID=A0AAV7PNA6_PLEWA|nr:hypothetical protein NDU88_008012 [Pleurodeles waltl]